MNAEKAVRAAPGVRERSARVIRLKEELNHILELVVHSRESLENELDSTFAQQKLSIDKPFISKLRELTSCYNSLTASRIALDKAETSLEKELTPSEEKAAVMDFVASLEKAERAKMLKEMVAHHVSTLAAGGRRTDWTVPDA